MNDPLKKFVQQHREAFDQLEPPKGVLERLQAQRQLEDTPPGPATERHRLGRRRRTAWLAAASLLVGAVCAYLFFDGSPMQRRSEPQVVRQQRVDPVPLTAEPAPPPVAAQKERSDEPAVAVAEPAEPRLREARHAAVNREPAPTPAPLSLGVRLADSTSASTRLAAILEIEQSRSIDERFLAMLSETMNRDGNTNVRLAALDVLSNHLDNPQVADMLATALTRQDDPLVQLGIVRIAAQLDHVGIEEALFAVARSPYTFEAVKDEAYAVLLYQEKL